jgi:hypothetical protein
MTMNRNIRGSGSIRVKLYGSVLYAMFSGGFLGFAVGPGYANHLINPGDNLIPIHHWRAAFFAV